MNFCSSCCSSSTVPIHHRLGRRLAKPRHRDTRHGPSFRSLTLLSVTMLLFHCPNPVTATIRRSGTFSRNLPSRAGPLLTRRALTTSTARGSTSTSAASSTFSNSAAGGPDRQAVRVSGMNWSVCGGGPPGGPMLQPDTVTLTPDPPHHGRTMLVNISGTAPVNADDGKLEVAVSYMGVKVYTYSSPLCDAVPCPLAAGAPFLLSVSQKLPALAPPGPYTLQITGEDAAGGRFMCVALAFHVATPGMGLGPVGAGARAGRGGVAGWGVNRRSDVDMSADFDE